MIELQYSSITGIELLERERFYRNITWVFASMDPFSKGRLAFYPNPAKGEYFRWFVWEHARKSITVAKGLMYLDVGCNVFAVRKVTPDDLPRHEFGYMTFCKSVVRSMMREHA